jgi:hypothetical protein
VGVITVSVDDEVERRFRELLLQQKKCLNIVIVIKSMFLDTLLLQVIFKKNLV